MIPIGVHQCCHCSHTSTPNSNTANSSQASQILENHINIFPFMVAKGNIFAIRNPTTRKVKSEKGGIMTENGGNTMLTIYGNT